MENYILVVSLTRIKTLHLSSHAKNLQLTQSRQTNFHANYTKPNPHVRLRDDRLRFLSSWSCARDGGV